MLDSNTKWDIRFLELARFIGSWSKDPSTKTGAVITDDKRRIVSVGYNGFARGVSDTEERLKDREIKYKLIVHCERNAILFANRSLNGFTLYTWPFMSCAPCAAMVIQSGIKRCVTIRSDNPRWLDDFKLTEMMYKEAGVEITLYEAEMVKGRCAIELNQIQKDLWDWEREHFPSAIDHPEQFVTGMNEEAGEVFQAISQLLELYRNAGKIVESTGEINHLILKSIQRIREGKDGFTDEVKSKIADGVFDTMIFGIQLLSSIGMKFEEGFLGTISDVLQRDWNEFRSRE